MTIPPVHYVVNEQDQKVSVQLSVEEWERFVLAFRQMEARLSPKTIPATDEAEILRRVEAGEADIRAGRVATTAEVRERMGC